MTSFPGDGSFGSCTPTVPATLTIVAHGKGAYQRRGVGTVVSALTLADGTVLEHSSAGWIRLRSLYAIAPGQRHDVATQAADRAAVASSNEEARLRRSVDVPELGSQVSGGTNVGSLLTGTAAGGAGGGGGSRQRVEKAADGPCWPLLAVETARYMQGGDGTVTRHLSGGVKHVLLPDGGVSWWVPHGKPLPPRYAALFADSELEDSKASGCSVCG